MNERAVLLPRLLDHPLPPRGMPAVPGGVREDRNIDRDLDETLVEVGVLLRVGFVPRRAVSRGPVSVRFRPRAGVIHAVVADEVGRVGREEDRALAVHEPCDVGGVRGVAAKEAVLAERPELARFDAPLIPELLGLLEVRARVVERLRTRLSAVL